MVKKLNNVKYLYLFIVFIEKYKKNLKLMNPTK